MGFDDRFNTISSSDIGSYMNGTTRHDAARARTFSSEDAGFVDIVRYYLWLGNQAW
jgi:hypothetical protein